MARHKQWHVSGCAAYLLAPIAIPLVLFIKFAERLFGLKTTADLSPQDVESYLQDFIEKRGGDWNWDDFTSIPITDPSLDEVRRQAALVDLPLTDQGRVKLRDLLAHVRSMTRDSDNASIP